MRQVQQCIIKDKDSREQHRHLGGMVGHKDMICSIQKINKGKGMLNMQSKEKNGYWLEITYILA